MCPSRATLFGPDRTILDQQAIPLSEGAKGSGLGPVQSPALTAQVAEPGAYGPNVTVSNDRYGDDIA